MKVSYAQFQLENLFNNDSFLNKIGNRVINDNYEVFLNELVPGLEESLGKIFSSTYYIYMLQTHKLTN